MKKIFGSIFLLILLGTNWVSAQCPGIVSPEPTCIRVMPNGDVEVDFDIPSMGGAAPLDINSFELHYSSNGSTWPNPPAATITGFGSSWPAATITHVGANQQNPNQVYYRLIAVCVGPPLTNLPPSSTIQAVKLDKTISNDFEVNLTWNWDQLSSGLQVNVNRDLLPFATWSLAPGGAPAYLQANMSFTDTVVTCNDSAKYRIVMNNLGSVCQTISSITGPFQIKDNTDPIPVTLDTVSFDPITNRPLVTFTPSSKDTKGYTILYMDDQCINYSLVDTIFGRFNNSFVDLLAWPGTGPARYSVIPFDECNRTAAPSVCEASMFLTPSLDVCDKSVRLDWNRYNGFTSGSDVLYKVFVSIAGSNFVLVTTTKDNFFNHTDPVQNAILEYKIVAFENGGLGPSTTSSNTVEVDAEFLKQPKMQYLRFANVSARNQIQLQLYTDIASDAHTYDLKRSLDSIGPFLTVNRFFAPEIKIDGDSIIYMTDDDPQTEYYSYYYKVDLFDSCGSFMTESNFASSMVLRVQPNQTARVNRLEWTNVFGWEGGTSSYRIHRLLDGEELGATLTKFPDTGAVTVYYDSLLLINDNITAGNPSKGNYCYFIEAVENDPSYPRMKPATTYSNQVCVVQEPYSSKANAFTPNGDGKNEKFRPVLIYHDITSYEFFILSRYGEVIYQTTNVDAAWDGTYNGKPAPEGAYVYTLKYRSSTGESFEDISTLLLLR